ncbi:MAG: flagellar assembly protein FliW [Dehalococcoidia bacterium]
MRITTYRFGIAEPVDVPDEAIIEIRPGLNGFEHLHRYALIAEDDSPVEWLQSLEEPEVAFALLEPFLFYPEYGFELSDADCEALALSRPEDAAVRCILTLNQSADEITANLLAPVVLSRTSRRARQIVLQDSNLPLRFPVIEALRLPLSA